MALLKALSVIFLVVGVSSATELNSAALERYPSIVQVESYDITTQSWGQTCGGVILNVFYILSAASCFTGPLYDPFFRRARAGSANRASGGQFVFVLREINHPNFIPGEVNSDISVVRLMHPFIYSENVRNSPIADPATILPLGMPVVQVGWGSAGNASETLEMAPVFTLRPSDCDLPDNTSGQIVLCAERFGPPSTNQDIGGPWYVENITVAVVSTTFNNNVAAVAVAPYTRWIVENAV